MTDFTAPADCCAAEPVAPVAAPDPGPAPVAHDVAPVDAATVPVTPDVAPVDAVAAPATSDVAPVDTAPPPADFAHDPQSWLNDMDGGQPAGTPAADFSHDSQSWLDGVDGGQSANPPAADFSHDSASWLDTPQDAPAAPDPGLQFNTSSWMQEMHGGGAPATTSFGDLLGSKWDFDNHLGVAHPTWADSDGDLVVNWLDHNDGAYG